MRLLATLGAFIFSGIISAAPLHNVVVFGDSLSDNGNLYEYMKHQLPQSPPYYEGRFSNGPVWIEYLIASYFPDNAPVHLKDYAVGGSGISEDEEDDEVLFTLRRQIKAYLIVNQNKADEDTLYVVWIGANNYLGTPDEVEHTINMVTGGVVNGLQSLVDVGAKHILVLNLPDLGKIPAAIEFGAVDLLHYFAEEHNKILANSVEQLKQNHPEVQWIFFDLNRMFSLVLDHGEEYGFTNTTGTCANTLIHLMPEKSVLHMVASTKLKTNTECDGFVFFDLVHPTGLAHKKIAEQVRIALDEAGVVFSE